MEKQIDLTKTQASIIRFAIARAHSPQPQAPNGLVQLMGPERQRAAMAVLKPLRVLFGDEQPNTAGGAGAWQFIYADKRLYTLRFDDVALAMLKEYWTTLNRGIFMNDDDSAEQVLAVDDAIAAAVEAPVKVSEAEPKALKALKVVPSKNGKPRAATEA